MTASPVARLDRKSRLQDCEGLSRPPHPSASRINGDPTALIPHLPLPRPSMVPQPHSPRTGPSLIPHQCCPGLTHCAPYQCYPQACWCWACWPNACQKRSSRSCRPSWPAWPRACRTPCVKCSWRRCARPPCSSRCARVGVRVGVCWWLVLPLLLPVQAALAGLMSGGGFGDCLWSSELVCVCVCARVHGMPNLRAVLLQGAAVDGGQGRHAPCGAQSTCGCTCVSA